MSSKRWVVVSSLGLGVALSCAEAEDQRAGFSDTPDDGGSSGSGGSSAASSSQGGKSSMAGTTASGGKVAMGGKGGAGGKGGTGNHAGTASEGGRAGSSTNEGGDTGSGGSNTAGTNAGGSGSTALGCVVEAVGGMPSGEGGAGSVGSAGEAAGGAPEMPVGGAASAGAASGSAGADPGPLALFFDDFEAGSAEKWTTAGGTWAILDDGSKVYEQSLLENKLQVAIASDVCVADQIIEARVKVTEFKGQSNSYVAALFGRALSPATHYLLALGSDKKLVLRKRINSTSTSATAIGSAVAFNATPDQWYDVRFELMGTTLKGCVGDVCVTGTDSSIASGSIGVGTVNTSARFDDVRLLAP